MWHRLRRLLSVYPSGLAGAGLALLRIAVAVMLFATPDLDRVLGTGGVLLIVGFLTPLAASATAVMLVLSFPPSATLHSEFSIVALTMACAAIALVGPGAWSADSWLFGRREIAIPRGPL